MEVCQSSLVLSVTSVDESATQRTTKPVIVKYYSAIRRGLYGNDIVVNGKSEVILSTTLPRTSQGQSGQTRIMSAVLQ